MNPTDLKTLTPNDADLLEARVAGRIATALEQQLDGLPAGVPQRLQFAREQALARARSLRTASAGGAVGSGGGLALLGPWWPRMASLLPALTLALGVLLVLDSKQREQVSVAAEIDAVLLADDLPPAAYADPGFVAFLKLHQP